ncbi:MAG: GNAT family N-acetyltransferase [Bacillota bacterium]|nr:GNAT family N-acetyltransferase [Bacillota bacterium]
MLKRLGREDFDDIFKIMDDSFPEDEYRPYEGQKALFCRTEYSVYGAVEESETAGFISVWEFEEFAYIEHFAVDSRFRNGGRGKEMLQELLRNIDKPFVLEVEPPETEITERRIGFYNRNGFAFNDYDYIQLPMWEGRNPVPLKIMSYPEALSQTDFEKVRDTIYREVFGVEI